MSPVSPFLIVPAVWAKRSQMDSPLPSSFHAPSIWQEAVAVPQKNPLGNAISENELNCRAGVVAGVAVPAFEDTLHPESRPAGRADRALALSAECRNLRRVTTNWTWAPSRIVGVVVARSGDSAVLVGFYVLALMFRDHILQQRLNLNGARSNQLQTGAGKPI